MCKTFWTSFSNPSKQRYAPPIINKDAQKLADELGRLDASQALGNACIRNSMNAKIVQEHVKNAVLKTNPALVARATKLAESLCEICVTGPSDSWMCVNFKEHG